MKSFPILAVGTLLIVIAAIYPSDSFPTDYVFSGGKTSGDDLEKVDRLGEEFQRQMPWSKEVPQSGAYEGTPQPEGYLSAPGREAKETEPSAAQYPYCYNPYTRRYEYCPGGRYPYHHPYYYYENYFYLRIGWPKFYFYWEGGESCPPDYYHRQGWGCYR